MPPDDITALITRLPDDDTSAPALLARGVDAVPALIAALRHRNREVRAIARELLVAIGAPAVPECVHALRDPFRRDALMVVLLRIGDPVPLIEALPTARANVQRFVRVVLQGMPPELVVTPLVRAYRRAGPADRMPFITALGMVPHAESIVALLELVTGGDDHHATHAVLALMEMQHDDATRALLLMLDHPDEWVATRTFSALLQLGNSGGVALVKHALLSSREFLRMMGVRAVPTLYRQGFLSYDDAADILQNLVRDKQFAVGIAATDALNELDHIKETDELRGEED
jgi:HEAT repeat protein